MLHFIDNPFRYPQPHLHMTDGNPEPYLLPKNYVELKCFRDIAFFWKWLLNPDIKQFPNFDAAQAANNAGGLGRGGVRMKVPRGSAALQRQTRREQLRRGQGATAKTKYKRMQSQLMWSWNGQSHEYTVQIYGIQIWCRPNPNATDPVTGKKVDPKKLPLHRYPSTATASYYLSAPEVKTEDDVVYRPNLPDFRTQPTYAKKKKAASTKGGTGGKGGKGGSSSSGRGGNKSGITKPGQAVLGQRDSELLISFLTVPYIRLPLVLTFFSSEDRIHKLQSVELRGILDAVLFEPGKHLGLDLGGVNPVMVRRRKSSYNVQGSENIYTEK